MSIIRKEISMIKATISNETKRNSFAKAGGKKIATGNCLTKRTHRGIVLNNYKLIATGVCSDMEKNNFNLNNIIAFRKQREVA